MRAAALDAASVRPGLITMIGLCKAHLARGGEKRARVAYRFHVDDDALRARDRRPGSRIRSPQPTSSMEPTETKALKPTISRRLQSRMAVQRAPLWLMNATFPGRAMMPAKVAFNPLCGRIRPRQFGPMIRIRYLRASSRMDRSSAAPGAPVSRKPAEMMIAPGIEARPHSAITPGTVAAGVAMTAKSIRSGTCSTLG